MINSIKAWNGASMARWRLQNRQYLSSGNRIRPLYLVLLCLSGLWLLSGCALQALQLREPPPLLGHTIPPVADANFTQISPAMLDFIDRNVDQDNGRIQTTRSLVWAAADQNIRPFLYRPELTLPPVESFDQHQGNCLSYSSMFMLMARHLGLDAWYQEVEIPQQWNNENNTLLVSIHVNVVVESDFGSHWVVDVSGRNTGRSQLHRRISDEVVLAQYYNNLGAEALTRNELGEAYAYIRKAIETEPNLHYLWSNLGVVYIRNSQVDAAMAAYLTALDIDPGSSMATNNLYLIYERTGNVLAAAEIQNRVDRNRRKNPYYLSHLSAVAFDEGRLDDSRELAERAVKLNQDEYRFHYQLARTLLEAGKKSEAEASLQRVLQLAPEVLRPELVGNLVGLSHLPELP
jgi:tetratricopeptide (TPR) repeat protein